MACASASCIRLKDKDAGPMVAKNNKKKNSLYILVQLKPVKFHDNLYNGFF